MFSILITGRNCQKLSFTRYEIVEGGTRTKELVHRSSGSQCSFALKRFAKTFVKGDNKLRFVMQILFPAVCQGSVEQSWHFDLNASCFAQAFMCIQSRSNN